MRRLNCERCHLTRHCSIEVLPSDDVISIQAERQAELERQRQMEEERLEQERKRAVSGNYFSILLNIIVSE